MSDIVRTNDDIYKAVSSFYRGKGLDRHEFIKRLKLIRSLIDGDETMNGAVDWLFVTEEIEFHSTASDEEIRKVKKTIREEIKSVLSLLNIKVSRNTLSEEKEV